eukprot:130531_1
MNWIKYCKKIKELDLSHKDALVVLDEEEEELEEEEEYEEEEEEEEDDEYDEQDVNSYHRKKKITKHDKQFIDEYEKMMEQFRTPNTKKTNVNNLQHASVIVGDLEKMGIKNIEQTQQTQEEQEDEEDENEDEPERVPFRLLSKKGVNSSKLKIGMIKIPRQVIASMKSNQRKDIVQDDKIKSVTLQHLQHYQNEECTDDEDDGYEEMERIDNCEMIDDKNNIVHYESTTKTKHKTKQHSLSAKRKYKQNLKQKEKQKMEDERERQKNQRDEKRKKQAR